jgi:predicted ATP-grasp superfamily ATP-dependent carboligase
MRNLARHGLEVYVGDTDKIFMSSVSRYSKKSFSYPSFRKDPEGFIYRVIKFIKENDIGTYLPSHEEILVVSKNIDRFPANVKIPISEYEKIYTLYNKKLSGELAEKLGIPVPKTYSVSSLKEFKDNLENYPIPAVIKMQNSNAAHGVFFAYSAEELKKKYIKVVETFHVKNNFPLIQQRIGAKIYAVSLLADKGDVIAQFVRRNIREKETFGGVCTKCESVHHDKVLVYAIKMLACLEFTGVAMFEFLVDEKKDSAYFMEANPRYWGTVDHDISCGVEFPFYQFCLANGIEFKPKDDYKSGLKSRWIVGDAISFLNKTKQSKSIRENLKCYLTFDDNNFMDFKLEDPLPFFFEAYFYLIDFIKTKFFNKREDGMVS